MLTESVVRVLVANDQEWTGRALESIFAAEGWEVIRAYTGQQAVDRALARLPDLVVLDFQLPDISGPEVCRQLRLDPRIGWGTPIIITTAGNNGRPRQLEALEAGAWDFATQPFDGPLLMARLATFIRARQALQAAERQAHIDETTGLYNARGLSRRLEELALDTARRQEPLSCVVFSAVMPDLVEAAHSALDLSRTIGKAIRESVRGSDAVGMIGPMEYAVLVPAMAREAANALVHRVERSVQALRPEGAPPPKLAAAVLDVGADARLDDLIRAAGGPGQAETAGSSA